MTGTYDQWWILEIWTPFVKALKRPSLHQRCNLTFVSIKHLQSSTEILVLDPKGHNKFLEVGF